MRDELHRRKATVRTYCLDGRREGRKGENEDGIWVKMRGLRSIVQRVQGMGIIWNKRDGWEERNWTMLMDGRPKKGLMKRKRRRWGYSDRERGVCKMQESDRVPAHETKGEVQGNTNGSGPRKKRVPDSVKSPASNNRKQSPMQMEEGGIRVRVVGFKSLYGTDELTTRLKSRTEGKNSLQ